MKDKRCKRVFMTHIQGDYDSDAIFPHEVMKSEGFVKENTDNVDCEVFQKFSSTNPQLENGVIYDFSCYVRK